MAKWSVIEHRGYNDFKYGSFSVYATPKEIVIRGVLKKTNQHSMYLLLRRN